MTRPSPLGRIRTLTARIAVLEAERDGAVAAARAQDATWTQIGRALGISAQAAHKRYRWLRHSPATGETWHEPPLPI